MKKITQSLLALAAIAIVFASCGNKASSSDPKVVLKEFFERLSKKDIDGAAKLATKDSKSTLDMMKKGLDMAEKMKDAKMPDEKDMADEFKEVEFGDAKINGDVATVPMRHKSKNEESEMTLKKEDGEWKVDFSMAALRNMDKSGGGMDGMDESGEDINPEDLQKNIDSVMKNMDTAQLREMQKAMDKLKDQQ